MASLILGIGGAVGGAMVGIPPQIGGAIGASIGGMIDNKLFPDKTAGSGKPPPLQISSYGKPLPKLFGPENRLAGNVVWTAGLVKNESDDGFNILGALTGGLAFGAKNSLTPQQDTYKTSIAVALCEGARGPGDNRGAIKGIKRIWANSKLIYDADGPINTGVSSPDQPQGFLYDILLGPIALLFGQQHGSTHAVFDTMAVYPGDFGQLPDPTIEAKEGVGNVPAYRGTAYIVLKDLQLADYGNKIPNLEFLVVADDAVTVGAIAAEIIGECGVPENEVSLFGLDDTVQGYAITSSASGVGALQPLALAFNFDVAEVAGGLRLVRRGRAPLAVVPTLQLGGREGGSDGSSAPRLTIEGTLATELPRESAVGFTDPVRDWQPNTATSRRQTGSMQNNLAVTLPLVCTVAQAAQIADRTLWEAWTARQSMKATTDDRWINIEPGRVYLFETPVGLEGFRITRRTRGANGVIEVEGVRDRDEVYKSTSQGVGAQVPDNPLDLPGRTELILLDIPILLDDDDGPGFYFAVVGSGTGWRGADVERALEASGDFLEVAPMGTEARVGDVTGTFPDGPTSGFDETTVLTVTLRRPDMTLSSASDDELDEGLNACFVGDLVDTSTGEIAQFGTATKVSAGVYQLSHWRRGLKGTEFATAVHAPGESFVPLGIGVEKRADFGQADLELERLYKAVSILLAQDDADAIFFTNTGVGLRPYSPAALDVSGDTGDDLELSWTRRSRLSTGDLGQGETPEAYRVRIMDPTGVTVLREVDVTDTAFVYTAAMQTADFGGPVSDLRWRVAQISTIFGPGIFAESNGAVPTSEGFST